MNNDKKKLEAALNLYLEDNSLEEFLEEFNITPQEAIEVLFDEGLIDPELLESFIPADV